MAHSLFIRACSATMSLCAGFPARFATSRRRAGSFIPGSLLIEAKELISKLLSFQKPLVYAYLSQAGNSMLRITLGVL